MVSQKGHHGNSKPIQEWSWHKTKDSNRTKNEGLGSIDHNIGVDGKSDCKGDDIVNKNDIDDSFEDFIKHFQVSVQDDNTNH